MSATHRYFNGATLTFKGTAVTKIVGISYKNGGQWIDVTQPEDANKLYELSPQPDFEVQVKYKGACSLTRGDRGTLAIAWSDSSTSECPGTWQCGPIDKSGDWDAPITGSVTFRPTVAST